MQTLSLLSPGPTGRPPSSPRFWPWCRYPRPSLPLSQTLEPRLFLEATVSASLPEGAWRWSGGHVSMATREAERHHTTAGGLESVPSSRGRARTQRSSFSCLRRRCPVFQLSLCWAHFLAPGLPEGLRDRSGHPVAQAHAVGRG